MGIINQLDFQVANLIAAGEVVDRPASACKEMLENAIDAGASNVTVEIQNGGVRFMRVSDNGKGMAREDVPLAIKRHATSKIKNAEDLNAIATLGFRGEALAAISSVSTLRIYTKRREDQVGTLLECEPGCDPKLAEIGLSDGTTVIAENLFANVPARRKFLKKDQTEAMAVTAAIEKVALSHPEIAIRLIIDGQTRFATAGDGLLKNTIYAVMGREFAMKLIPVKNTTVSEYDGAKISVEGFIGTPDNIRANRNYQNFFINGRYVKSKCAQAALEQAFTSYSPADKFPTCVLNITLPPSLVDVNVHPAKLEVKFSNEKSVFEAIYYAVRGALEEKIPRPKLEVGESQTVGDFCYEMMKQQKASAVKNAFVPLTDAADRVPLPKSPYNNQKNVKAGQISYLDRDNISEEMPSVLPIEELIPPPAKDEKASLPETPGNRFRKDEPIPKSTGKTEILPPEIDVIQTAHEALLERKEARENPKPESVTPLPGKKEIPDYKIIGEAFLSYVFVEVGDKVLIIDKHAAHERIIFEDLRRNLQTHILTSQILLAPIDVSLSPDEMAALSDYEKDIRGLGFDYFKRDENTVSVSAIPSGIEAEATADMIETIAGRIASGTGDAVISRDLLFEKALWQASCKAAIKIGHEHDPGHIKWICDQLLSLDDIKFCPHGRPVAFELSKHMLEHQFKRN